MDISLITFAEEHIRQTFDWVQDPKLQKSFMIRGDITWQGHQTHFKKILNDSTQRVYAIIFSGEHVGNCGLKHLSLTKKEGELWIYIGETSQRNKGIGRKAVELLLAKGFVELSLREICLHVANFNTAVLDFYKKLGFCESPVNDESEEWDKRADKVIRLSLKHDNDRVMDVAMMQPAFMPWQGYFGLIDKSEIFIFLDDFQFSVQSYHQRNRLFVNRGQVDWCTVPVLKSISFKAPLNETKINETVPWRKKMWRRIQNNYSKTFYYSQVAPHVERWFLNKAESLASQNIEFIKMVCNLLGIKRDFRLSSQLPSKAVRSSRVLELLKWCNAKRYFSAKGAFSYMLEDGVFPADGIEVFFQNYQHKSYEQVGAKDGFVPFLSILDAMFNTGCEETLNLITSRDQKWLSWNDMLSQEDR